MEIIRILKFIATHPLNQGHQVAALAAFFRWQARSRFISGDIVFPWFQGAQFYVRRGETGLTGNMYTGLHEFTDMAFLLHVLRNEDLFVDVGANAGSYTLLAAAVAGAETIAFEPVPETFERLSANVRLNRLENRVTCINKGLADTDGRLAFTSHLDTINHALAPEEASNGAIEVDVTTLDAALAGRRPAVLKIDVEGFETSVLAGAGTTLTDPGLHFVIMELNGSGNRYGFDETAIADGMADLGFQPHAYRPFERTLVPASAGDSAMGNTLFVRNSPELLERLATAPCFEWNGNAF